MSRHSSKTPCPCKLSRHFPESPSHRRASRALWPIPQNRVALGLDLGQSFESTCCAFQELCVWPGPVPSTCQPAVTLPRLMHTQGRRQFRRGASICFPLNSAVGGSLHSPLSRRLHGRCWDKTWCLPPGIASLRERRTCTERCYLRQVCRGPRGARGSRRRWHRLGPGHWWWVTVAKCQAVGVGNAARGILVTSECGVLT